MHKSLFLLYQISKTRAIFFARIFENLLVLASSCAWLNLLLAELVRHCLYLVHIFTYASAHRREHRLVRAQRALTIIYFAQRCLRKHGNQPWSMLA